MIGANVQGENSAHGNEQHGNPAYHCMASVATRSQKLTNIDRMYDEAFSHLNMHEYHG